MKFIKAGLILTLTMAILFSAGCGEQEKVTLGTMEGNTYVNDYFDLRVDLPHDWYILTHEELAEVSQVGQDFIGEYNEDLAEDVSDQQNLNLFGTWKHPLPHYHGYNPNIICVAENLGLAGGIKVKTGNDYLKLTKDLLLESNIPMQFGQITSDKVGNKTFDILSATWTLEGMEIKQKYYSTIVKGYALSFIISYNTDSELKSLQEILDTIQLAK